MRTRFILSVGLAAGILVWGGAVLGQSQPPDCDQRRARTPEKVEGQVIKVDPEQGKLTVRGTDGTTHEFQAAKETLQDLKAGDRLQAKLRSAPNCP